MNVVQATAENYSSMAQDVKFKRRTEIEFINGYLVRHGERLDIITTENKKLVADISKI